MFAVVQELIDVLAVLFGAVLAHAQVFGGGMPWPPGELVATGGVLACHWIVASKLRSNGLESVAAKNAMRAASALVALQVVFAIWIATVPALRFDSTRWFIVWSLLSLGMLASASAFGAILFHKIRQSTSRPRHVIVVGEAAFCRALLNSAREQGEAFVTVGSFDPQARGDVQKFDVHVLASFDEVISWVRSRLCNEIWLALPLTQESGIRSYLTELQNDLVNIRLFPDVREMPVFNHSIEDIAGRPAINLVASPSRRDNGAIKALFDRVFALFALVFLSPLLLAIAVAVKASSPGPVFFRQRRKGIDGSEFLILKFRSMYVHKETSGTLTQASRDDARVTPLGRMLRRFSLDELPQFINVLRGQMSVVGPRPHALEHDDYYMRLVDGYMHRYRIKPGITGWAQVNGFRGETARVERMAARVSHDLFYVQNWTFWLDLKIVAMTIFRTPFNSNAY